MSPENGAKFTKIYLAGRGGVRQKFGVRGRCLLTVGRVKSGDVFTRLANKKVRQKE